MRRPPDKEELDDPVELAVIERTERAKKAWALLEQHPIFHSVQIEVYEKTLAIETAEPLESFTLNTDARLERLLKSFDIRAAAFLRLVSNLEHHKAYAVMLEVFIVEAWAHLCHIPLDVIHRPMPGQPLNELQAKVKKFWERGQRWSIEGHRQLDTLKKPHQPQGRGERRGYRTEIDEWMKREGLTSLDQARRRLGISKDTLKSIRSSKGEKKYSDETLAKVLKQIGPKG